MHEIVFSYPGNEITANHVHTQHHRALYLDFLLPTLAKQRVTDATDQFATELGQWYVGWASSEVLVFGYVSLFHLWERQIAGLLGRQLGRFGVELPTRGRGSIVAFAKRVLVEEFGIQLAPELWRPVELGLLVANAVKHGGRSMSKLVCSAPAFVSPGSTAADPIVTVSDVQFGQLCDGLVAFWNALPHKIDYRRHEPVA